MSLPETPGQRISDLCNENHITQKQLAEKIGAASQLSRIVSGETKTVSSDILIGVAKEFKVSTDYILGLSTVSVRKSYDISELGLSEGAVKGLVTGSVDVEILNRLLEHKNFPRRIRLIRITLKQYLPGSQKSADHPYQAFSLFLNLTADMFQNILTSAKKNAPIILDNVIPIITNQLSLTIEMNDEAKELFETLFLQIIKI